MDEIRVKQLTNKVVLTINSLLSLFLVVGYFVEYLKGNRSLGYILSFIMTVIIPIALAIIVYNRNKQSEVMKYITLTGYMVIYTLALTTTNTSSTFVYIFPIMLMYILYFNLRLTVYSYSYVFLINVGVIGYKIITGNVDKSSSTELTIQFAAVILFGIAIILSTKLSNQFNFSKINSIKSQQQKQDEIISNILKAADIMEANAKDLHSFMDKFNMSMNQVSGAIDEISKGAQETSENMTQQAINSEKISELIDVTSKLSMQMGELSKNSAEDVSKGLEIVNELNDKAIIVNQQSQRVEELMLELKEKTNEILGITSIISGISAQTNLLSLNASIEAARAGESGKGFAVVADEIRQLADQSRQSSSKISTIIDDLNTKVIECFDQIESTKTANIEQNENIKNTKTVYNSINSNTNQLFGNIEEVNYKITTIVESNNNIKEGISRIAAVSQQTAANSEEANAMACENMAGAGELMNKINEILEIAEQMKKYAV